MTPLRDLAGLATAAGKYRLNTTATSASSTIA